MLSNSYLYKSFSSNRKYIRRNLTMVEESNRNIIKCNNFLTEVLDEFREEVMVVGY